MANIKKEDHGVITNAQIATGRLQVQAKGITTSQPVLVRGTNMETGAPFSRVFANIFVAEQWLATFESDQYEITSVSGSS